MIGADARALRRAPGLRAGHEARGKYSMNAVSLVSLRLQPETVDAIRSVPEGTVSEAAMARGLRLGEPLLIILDGLLRYAKAHRARFEGPLADDGFLGPQWLAAAVAARALLNGDGAAAHEMGISTDSKDNGAMERVFWSAMAAAGFSEADLG